MKTNLLDLVEPYLKDTDNLDAIGGIVDKIKLDRRLWKPLIKSNPMSGLR